MTDEAIISELRETNKLLHELLGVSINLLRRSKTILTIDDAAIFLKTSEAELMRKVECGRLKSYYFRGIHHFALEDIKRLYALEKDRKRRERDHTKTKNRKK